MNTAVFNFADSLSELLPKQIRGQPVPLRFGDRQSVKHLVESLGIPHVEVGKVLANDQVVGLGYLVHNGDRVAVQPALNAFPPEPCFLLDGHLGRLAAYLRMLGFDTLYRNNYHDSELAEIASEGRILLSRDRRLLMRKIVKYGYCLRSTEPTVQLIEVVRRFDLADHIVPFQRCLRCNSPLELIEKEKILDRLQPLTKRFYDEFAICPACDQIYWKGSHYEHMLEIIKRTCR
jgi:uncharacterized protein with PIN domain